MPVSMEIYCQYHIRQ